MDIPDRTYWPKMSRVGAVDWKLPGLGDAHRYEVDYIRRKAGQVRFYSADRRVHAAVARAAGALTEKDMQPKVKPQIAPCHAGLWPPPMAARAAIGMGGFLEYQARVKNGFLKAYMGSYLKDPALADGASCDPASYSKTAQWVTGSVETYLIFQDLSRVTASPAMEMYRLFMANSGQLSAPLLEAVIHAGVVFGDVMPPPGSLNLHPMTRDILEAILEACQGHRSRIRDAESGRVLRLASRWIKEVCRALLGFMPPREEPEAEGDPELIRKMKEILDNEDLEIPSFMRRRRFPKDPPTLSGEPPERFAPLDDPRPPSLHKPESESERIARSLKDPARDSQNRLETGKSASNMSKKTREVLDSLGKSLEEAAGQPSKAQDMKSEIVAAALFDRPFDEGPIQGEPATGAEVAVDLGDVVGRVEVHDRPISPSNHGETVALLTREARGIAELLQRYIYTNVKRYTEMRRLRTRGSLDPARLAMAGFSNTVYRSFQTRSAGDRQGRPLLVLGIDASASNSSAQIRVGKLLTAAYLMSARRHGVRVLSGIYSSGPIRRGLSGTLIQWLYHPQKTLTHSPADAVRSVAAMPDMGSGAQKDVVSVARILEEARTLARGNRIYLVLITDCEWNVSLHMGKSGFEEVKGFFSEAARKANGSLHTTLVAVGKDAPTDLEDVLDAVIRIPADKLEDVGAVANQLARHVADCIRTHRRGRSGR